MSAITIVYSQLEDSVSKAQKVQSEIDGYISEIRKRVITPSSDLPGSDSSGYVSTAAQLAQQKINQLNEKSGRFSDFEKKLNSFISTAQDKDEYVSNRIEEIADSVIGERKWYQKVGDWLYNTFCVDLANMNAITRFLADITEIMEIARDYAFDRIKAWFKYGDGKYIATIVLSIVGTALAIAGAIAAVAAAPFTGGVSLGGLVLCIGAIASCATAIFSTVNTLATVWDNGKALSLSGNIFDGYDGNLGKARYYGNVDKLSEHWERTDMGDAATNQKYEIAGTTIDVLTTIAEVTETVTGIVGLATVKDFRFKYDYKDTKNIKFDWSYENIKKNILHDLGYKSNGKFDWESLNPFKDIEKMGKKFKYKGKYLIPESIVRIFQGAKAVDITTNIISDIDSIAEAFNGREKGLTAVDNFLDGATGLMDNFDIVGFFDDIYSPVGIIKDLKEIFPIKIYKEPSY